MRKERNMMSDNRFNRNKTNNEAVSPAAEDALKNFNKAVFKKRVLSYLKISAACFAVLFVFTITAQQISKIGGNSAASKSIVKFAKVEDMEDENKDPVEENTNVGVLAGASGSVTAKKEMQTIGEALDTLQGNREEAEYDEIVLGQNPVWNQDRSPADTESGEDVPSIEKNDNGSSSESGFTAWTSCSANVRTVPDKDSGEVLAVKKRGEVFKVTGEAGDFWEVKWGDSSSAYIHKSCMTQTQP